jgi:AraC-like DNA-binding protein
MPATKPIVRASVLMGFDRFLTQRGIDAKTLYAKAGLPAPELIDIETDLSGNGVAQLFDDAGRAANDPCIGLSWAEAFPIGGTGLVGYLLLNSPTIGAAMATVARYAVLFRQPMIVQFEENDDGGLLWWRWPEALTAPYTQYGTYSLALFILRLRMLTEPKWEPLLVELQGEPLTCKDKVRRILGPNVQFGADKNALQVDTATLNTPIPAADPRLRPILEKLGEQMIAEFPALDDIAARVRNAILDLLPLRRASLDDVATQIGLTGRTLQSRLAQASTTFEKVLNDTLKSRAEHLLRTTDLSLTDIAILLGFSELSAFTRASQKRWFGRTPSAQRQILRSELEK